MQAKLNSQLKNNENLDYNVVKNNILNPYLQRLNNASNVYIFGAKQLGVKILKFCEKTNIKVDGFIDNNKSFQGQLVEGLKVFSPDEIKNKNAVIIVASINYVTEISKQLIQKEYNNIIPYHILTLFFEKDFEPEPSLNGLLEDLTKNFIEYSKLYDLLKDEQSKKVLNNIIEFRKTYNINLYGEICDDIDKSYFEDFMPDNEEVFVDGGAFDGDTAIRFLKFQKNYQKIYFFEPDQISFEKAKKNLISVKNIDFYQAGISDCEKVLKFSETNDPGSSFSNEGTIEVKCVSLDETIKEDRAFIKLDIEGAEEEAIEGAKRLIKNGSPLAICVYHKPHDIWKIPNQILKINPQYKFRLRHYTNTIFDTILYGVIL